MTTWRCEYRWLLVFWPVACVVWWVTAVGSLIGMARKVDVFRESDKAPMPWRALLLMSYTALLKENRTTRSSGVHAQHTDAKPYDNTRLQASSLPSTLPSNDDDSDSLIVRLELPSEAHLRWWNTAVQAVAVGIYLYATFVLSSVLFLTGQEAILYAVGMTLSLSAIRIMTALL